MNTVINWLQSYPDWEGALYVDNLVYRPGSCGLYNQGITVVAHQKDILGNTKQRMQWKFQLRRLVPRGQDNSHHAHWMLDIQRWVMDQNAQGLAPQLGENTHWYTQNSVLSKSDRPDTCLYTVDLVAEYDIEMQGGIL